MSKNYKKSYKMYTAWNYQREIEDLDKASEQGWQLVKGGCFHSKFVKNPNIRYRYQMDYGDIEDMGRYIESFREQGWEYVNSTFNDWHYFRKIYDPALPEEAYEIFTDWESFNEMNNRWARLGLIIGAVAGVMALGLGVRAILKPSLPLILQCLALLIESVLLLRGVFIMKNPKASRNRPGDATIFVVFLAVMLLGVGGGLVLMGLRPSLSTGQNSTEISAPIVDNRWVDFKVRYPDNYYIDLEIDADSPLTFEIINEDDKSVYTVTDTSFSGKDIRLKLPTGQYWFSMTCDSPFKLNCSID